MPFGNFFKVCEIMEPDGKVHRKRHLVVKNDFEPMIPEDEFDREMWFIDFIYKIQEALAGEEFAMAQMKNIRMDRSGIWKKVDVLEAFSSYDPDKIPNWDHRQESGISLDPGVVHGTGIVEGFRDLKSGDLWITLAEKRYGTEIPEDKFLRMMRDHYDETIADWIISESNSGGLEWVIFLKNAGYNAEVANFGTANEATGDVTNSQKAVERHFKERILKWLFENKKIHIVKSKELFKEFSLYNPYENKEKGKGDIIDALLHFVFKIMGGIDFIMELIEREGIEQTDGAILI
jgi:hypothetical protein